MAVVYKYAPSRADLIEDALIWLERREGPCLAPIRSSSRPERVEEERDRLAEMSSEDLVLHLARRSVRRRPTMDEVRTLLRFRDDRAQAGDTWFPSSDHPLITGGSVKHDNGGRVQNFMLWNQTGQLDVSVAFLVRHFGRYGRVQYRLARGRDEDTNFDFAFFRGGRLRFFRASTPRTFKSPLDDPGTSGDLSRESLEAVLAASDRQAEGSLLYFDPSVREYRAVSEEEVFCTSFTFSFELSGDTGPYRLWWLKKRSLYRP
jgi:hypothetical protein